jgi:amidase
VLTLVSDDPKIYDGAHVSLQIVGRRFQEEKMLAIADVTTAALKAL